MTSTCRSTSLASAQDQAALLIFPKLIGQLIQKSRRTAIQRLACRRLELHAGLLSQPGRQVIQAGGHFFRSHAHPVVRFAARDRERRLELHVLGQTRRRPFQLPAELIGMRKLNRRNPGAEEVGLEADDHGRVAEAEVGKHSNAVSPRMRIENG